MKFLNTLLLPHFTALPTVGTVGRVVEFNNDIWFDNGVAWVALGLINTDSNPGDRIFAGSIDPSGTYTLQTGDIWIN